MALALARDIKDLYARTTRHTAPEVDTFTFGLATAQSNLDPKERAELINCLDQATIQPLIATFSKLKQEFSDGDSIETSTMKFLRILETSNLAVRTPLILGLPGGDNWLDSISALALHFDFFIKDSKHLSEEAMRRVITGLMVQIISGPDRLRALTCVKGFGSADMLTDWKD